jgi:nucleotide-binding universal stress UspA family protein
MNTILLATDGSPSAQNATATAIELAADTGWHLKVVSVWSFRSLVFGEIPADAWKRIEDTEREHAENVVEEALEAARAQGIEADGAVLQGDPVSEICEAARGATLVVVGAHGWGSVRRLVFGSVSSAVLHHAPCPVLVVRGGGDDVTKELGAATAASTGQKGEPT